jgi:membrane-bound lytic murein transglycosylase D
MHRNRTIKALAALVVSAACVISAPGAGRAQTVLSPTPFMSIQELPSAEPDAVVPDAEEHEDAGERLFQIPLIFNESVESQIEYFTTRGRSVFQAWLDRSARYVPLMKSIFREYNLPEDLVYIAMIESGFNFKAVSPKKAVGFWQFMKATAREYGLNADRWVDERRDPIKSTRAAAAHLKDLYNLFGSWPMALASYNAGMGRMQGAAVKAKSDDFWEIRSTRFLGAETQDYVPRYMAALIIARDPVSYGFSDPVTEPFEYDEIVVPQSTDLRRIAASTGASYEDLCALNPELLQPLTPTSKYVLRVPPGTKLAYQQQVTKVAVQNKKLRDVRKRARSGGLLFSGLASTFRSSLPDALSPAALVSRYGHQVDIKNALLPEGAARRTASRDPGGAVKRLP